jgi:hypothetical protein
MDIGDIFNDAIMRMDDDDIKSLIIDFQTILSDRQIARSKKICDDFIEEHGYKTNNKWHKSDPKTDGACVVEGWLVNDCDRNTKLLVKLDHEKELCEVNFKINHPYHISIEGNKMNEVWYIQTGSTDTGDYKTWWSYKEPPSEFEDDRTGYKVEKWSSDVLFTRAWIAQSSAMSD